MKKRIFAITLAAALILTGCSKSTENKETKGNALPTATASADTQLSVDSEYDPENKVPQQTDVQESGTDTVITAPTVSGSEDTTASGTETASSKDAASGTAASSTNGSAEAAKTATGSIKATSGIKPTATQAANSNSSSVSGSASSGGSSSNTNVKTTSIQSGTSKPAAATAKATSAASKTATAKPAATTVATAAPTAKAVTYSFSPSKITVYSGDDTNKQVKIVDSNGNNISFKELDFDWFDIGSGMTKFAPGTEQKKGTYYVSDADVAQLSGVIYSDGTEDFSVDGFWGKIGTTTITCKHKSGHSLTLTVTSIKDERYAAYYHPYNWEVIDADMKAYIEGKNGVYDPTMIPEESGYFPGADAGGYKSQGQALYKFCIGSIDATITNLARVEADLGMTVNDLGGCRLYLWRKHTGGTVGANDEYYLFRCLYG